MSYKHEGHWSFKLVNPWPNSTYVGAFTYLFVFMVCYTISTWWNCHVLHMDYAMLSLGLYVFGDHLGYICVVITIPLILGVHNWMYFEADGYKNTCVCVMWHHRCFWCASQHVICHGHTFINTWIMPSHVTHHSTCDFVDSALLDMLHCNSKTFALYSLSTLFRSWNKWCKSYVKPTHQYCFILRLDCT